ncbi:FtsK/SpoIIIE family DNA translocase [Marinilabilia rubra]|uniref:Cell division protein FtsK n=1 Tax=Marinilabilia rubra TaxID=2162893 RepID=A0A2U2BAK0_9BACT|nr:DNA translocase FtsK [Marinilabilia rubra]PWE00094.1 cell division protein FtsK [Marinilabilia rubra]
MSTGKKNKTGKKNRKSGLSKWETNFKNFKFRFITGLALVAFSFYLALAFLSFFFTGFADRSKFDIAFWDFIKSAEITVQNWTGKFGAWLADTFINDWFGVASVSVVVLLFMTGIKLIGAKIMKLRKAFVHAALITIWTSVTLGFFFIDTINDQYLLFGGAHGYFLSKWFQAAIGWAGTFILILITLLAYFSFCFDWFIPLISKPFQKKEAKSDQSETEESTESEINVNHQSKIRAEEEQFEKTHAPLDEDLSLDRAVSGLSEAAESTATSHTPVPSHPKEEKEIVIKDDETLEMDFEPENTDKSLEHKGDEDLELKIEKAATEEISDHNEDRPLGDYDPTLDLSSYKLPTFDLLEEHDTDSGQVGEEELISNKNRIVKTLEDYKIQIKSIKATVGPTITLYEIVPAPGVRISKIKNLEDDIALSLAALGIRIIAPIPGRGTIGIEVPNSEPEIVSMRTIITSRKFQNSKFELPIAFGKTISNETYVLDLAKAPHMLVAGATGQGKSVGLNAIITSLLYKKHPSQLKFVLVDPKKVELNIYSKIEKHFLAKLPDEEESIITDVQRVVSTLHSLTIEMDERYDLLKKAHARNVKEYNHKFVKRQLNPEKGHRFLPYIVVIIDEFADLIMTAGKDVEMPIARIAQLARAVGIHMIIATQRPSTNIITGVIKANFPTRVAFKVASMIDSRTILDSPGANQLIGRGDMLITQGSDLVRVQCAFVDTPEVEQINDYIGAQQGYPSALILPEYNGGDGETAEPGEVDLSKRDPMFEEAARIVVANQSGSTSLIQRRFSIGYNRAGRIIDQLEAAGIVGPFEGSKARQVLVPDEYELEKVIDSIKG